MSFGARLTEARKRKGLTQEGLGKGLGTDGKDASKAVVYGWEKDQHFPRVDQLTLICERLGVTPNFLLLGEQSESDLLPEVADVASAISSLPQKQRNWVLMTARTAIEFARETVVVNGKAVGLANEPESEPVHTSSQRRRQR